MESKHSQNDSLEEWHCNVLLNKCNLETTPDALSQKTRSRKAQGEQ